MSVPIAVTRQGEINAAVNAVTAELQPHVQRIRYDIAEDWSGEWAIFFRVVLTDDAAKHRLREVATKIVWGLANRLNFPALGVYPYHNFRSESEQAVLQEETWK